MEESLSARRPIVDDLKFRLTIQQATGSYDIAAMSQTLERPYTLRMNKLHPLPSGGGGVML